MGNALRPHDLSRAFKARTSRSGSGVKCPSNIDRLNWAIKFSSGLELHRLYIRVGYQSKGIDQTILDIHAERRGRVLLFSKPENSKGDRVLKKAPI